MIGLVNPCHPGGRENHQTTVFQNPQSLLPENKSGRWALDGREGEALLMQVCVVTHKLTGQKRACKRVAIQTEMVGLLSGVVGGWPMGILFLREKATLV